MPELRLAVVIPVHNGAATLPRCLAAVRASRGVAFEVIVVDDGSTDATAALVAADPAIRRLRHERPRGAAAARNAGVAAARAPVVCFVDADVVVGPDLLAAADQSLRQSGADGVVGMLGRATEARNFASRYENLYMHFMFAHHADEMDFLFTSFAAIRRDVFLEAGGFDEAYAGAGIEDMELGQRLVGAGRRLRLDKRLEVLHLKRFGVWQLLRTNRRKAAGTLRIALRNRRQGRRSRKHVGPGWAFLAGIPLTGAALVLGAAGAVGGGRPALVGALGLLGLTAALNAGFLSFLARTEGLRFLVAAIPFLYVQFVNYGLGLAEGLAGYLAGRQY
ncbi:MAG: glycosyltransferase [Planctomycetes bacterium]|nr:glycosyltransferase [Planctomycetota bacterium]